MTGTHTIHISTDGSFLPGARPVTGWAWVDHTTGLHDCGGSLGGNIQLGELCAILQALRSHPGAEKLVIESDSRDAIEYSTKRESTWSQTGWLKDNGNPAPYFLSVIRAIHMEMEEREGSIDFIWVKGHAGDKFNEQADQFARGYATMCRDFHAPSKIPSEAQIDLMRVPLQLTGRVIQTGTDDMMQALDPDNSATVKADAPRTAMAAANTVGVVPVTVRHTPGTDDNHDAASPTAGGDTADAHTADTHAMDTAAATHTQRVVSSERSVNSQPSADSQDVFPQAQLLHDLTATLRKATHAQQKAAERYAKAAGIPPSARVADAEDNLNKAAKRQESLARVIHELVETLI
ncbi:RNase H family protein [Bifidobacterium apri]|uniref:Ribonuclease H n=1 Tax=Bifidobacterium apri TaxID=1769423 RepID=A0A6A2VX41_9BIFI|nr:RNase H family protein [Bifidobacterium apri]KAB8296635.1 ribonuclease H [Bifidobacterium apri]